MTRESLTAFNAFYSNHNQIQEKYTSYLKEVFEHLAGDPNVIGFNTMSNAPPGNSFLKPSLLAPGVADRKNLTPLYEKAFKILQNSNQKALMWFEPTSHTDAIPIFSGIVTPIGFEQAPGA